MTRVSNGALIEKLYASTPSPELDIEIWRAAGVTVDPYEAPPISASLDAAVSFAERVLPGWSWRAMKCHVSDDAWLIPDFLDPTEGERLRRTWRQDVDWTDFTDVDLRPSGRPALALCISVLLALEASLDTELMVAAEQSGKPILPASRDEMVVVPKSMLHDLYEFFHETGTGTGELTEPGSFGEETLRWRERIHNEIKMARFRKTGQEQKP